MLSDIEIKGCALVKEQNAKNIDLMLSHEIFPDPSYKLRSGIKFLQWYFLAVAKIQSDLLKTGCPCNTQCDLEFGKPCDFPA